MNRKQTVALALTLGALLASGAHAASSAPAQTPASPSGPATGPNAPMINTPTTVTPQPAQQPNGNANPARRNTGIGANDTPPVQDDYDRESRAGEMTQERQQSGQDMIDQRNGNADE